MYNFYWLNLVNGKKSTSVFFKFIYMYKHYRNEVETKTTVLWKSNVFIFGNLSGWLNESKCESKICITLLSVSFSLIFAVFGLWVYENFSMCGLWRRWWLDGVNFYFSLLALTWNMHGIQEMLWYENCDQKLKVP